MTLDIKKNYCFCVIVRNFYLFGLQFRPFLTKLLKGKTTPFPLPQISDLTKRSERIDLFFTITDNLDI